MQGTLTFLFLRRPLLNLALRDQRYFSVSGRIDGSHHFHHPAVIDAGIATNKNPHVRVIRGDGGKARNQPFQLNFRFL